MRSKYSQRHPAVPVTPLFCVTAIYLVACLILGGATRSGFLADVVLQILAVPLLLWAAWMLLDIPSTAGGRRGQVAILICVAAAALPMAQLIPLPPSVWPMLPGRADFVEVLEAAGLQPGWRPLSMSPRATWLSVLALLPPAALLLSALQLGYAERRRLALVLLLVGVGEAALGLLQLAQGPASPLRVFAFRNQSEAVGFFANRNHYSALLYCLVPIAVAFALTAANDAARAGRLLSQRAMQHVAAAMLGFAALVAFLAALAMARSRAGLGLMLVALLGSFAMTYVAPAGTSNRIFRRTHGAGARIGRRLLMATLVITMLFGAHLTFYRVQERFTVNPVADGRGPLFEDVIEAARAYMPLGSGIGTFVPVFQAFERPEYGFGDAYVNRAHNEYLELWLQAGIVGIVAMILLLTWGAVSFVSVWRVGMPGAQSRDNLLACAATLAPVLLLAHSMLDYPLRTSALMAVFALATAMAVAPVGLPAAGTSSSEPTPREDSEATFGAMADHQSSIDRAGRGQFVPATPRGDWPEAWRAPTRPEPPQTPIGQGEPKRR